MFNLFNLFKRTPDKKSQNSVPSITPSVVDCILPVSYKNVVLYDCVRNEINRSRYNGQVVVGRRPIADGVSDFKSFCANHPAFTGRVPVAIVAMTYAYNRSYTYSILGTYVAGNIIFYSPTTGEYSALLPGWFRAGRYFCHVAAAEEALLKTVQYIQNNREHIVRLAQDRIK